MEIRKGVSLGLLFGLFLVGGLLLGRPGGPGAELALRQQTMRQSMAPARTGDVHVSAVNADDEQPISPVFVNLADVPAGVYTPHNTYDQWLRGDIDLDEKEYRLSPPEIAALQAAALKLEPSANVQTAPDSQAALGPGLIPGTAFDSLDAGDCCGGGTSVPPDSHMAVGPNHIIAAVNVAFEIYDKSGSSLVGPITFESFFSSTPNCNNFAPNDPGLFDPNALYDESAGRYILGADANGDYFCMAVSVTNDPTGSWYQYAIPANVLNAFHDYPHMGVGADAIYMGGNQFGGAVPGGFEGRVWAFNKTKMYAGTALSAADRPTFSLGAGGGTPQPLHLHGYQQGSWPTGQPHYFVTDQYDGRRIDVWRWTNALAGGLPAIVATFDLATATGVAAGMPLDVPQLGSSNKLQANDYRLRGLEYRNGRAWVTDSISCNPGGGTVNCVRWAEINLTPSTPTLVQAGVYGSAGEYRTFPDLAVNHCGDMAIGYTKSNSSMYAGIWYTGRQSGDPAGMLQAEALLKAGEKAYSSFDPAPHRWGDYSSMTIDPDGLTFWYIGEYSKVVGAGPMANWGNYIGSFSYADCTVGPISTYVVYLPVIMRP